MDKSYPINEVFHTFQGEGLNLGRAAFFIRTHGCPIHCPWCDSAGTWHKDFIPKNIQRKTVGELLEMVKSSNASLAVLTGGEPLIHDLDPLIVALSGSRIEVAIETSGAFPPPRSKVACLTVSPKFNRLPLAETLRNASEWKLIIENPDGMTSWMDQLSVILQEDSFNYAISKKIPVWLHPEWREAKNSIILNAITSAIKQYPQVFRAGWQMHKNYRADALDARSAHPVPLGGNLENGY